MNQKHYFLPVGIFSLVIALLLLFLSSLGWLSFLSNGVSVSLYAVGQVVGAPFRIFSSPSSSEITKLKEENQRLTSQLAHLEAVEADNRALRDQFQTSIPTPLSLLPAKIVGKRSVLPGIATPEEIVVDKGTTNGVEVGMVVVYKDMLVGKITKATAYFSQVTLLGNTSLSFAGKDSNTQTIGVIKGLGGGDVVLDNVLLSDTLTRGDILVTDGGEDASGKGYPPGLIVGKISGVDKDPSALFQKAKVQLLFDSSRVTEVFVKVR